MYSGDISRDMNIRIGFLAGVFLGAAILTPCVWGQEKNQTPAPIQIEADRMESTRENNTVLFFGNVMASQDNLTINADRMTVLYENPEEPQKTENIDSNLNRKIDKIKAEGNVRIVQGEWVAAGDAMDFNGAEKIVTLTGNASAWQDQNMVSGEKIILYLNEGKSIVEGGPQDGERVKAFIYPSQQEKK